MKVGDPVFVCTEQTIHCARVGKRFFTGESVKTPDGDLETFKCRDIVDQKAFAFSDLPCAFRLLQITGRRAIQQIRSGERLARILANAATPKDVRDQMLLVPEEQFLCLLSAEGWETICLEYLRDRYGFRLLTLLPGGTIAHVDLVGVDADGRRFVAQCKNNDGPVSAKSVRDWLQLSGVPNEQQKLAYCARSGVKDALEVMREHPHLIVITGEEVLQWLKGLPKYFNALKLL